MLFIKRLKKWNFVSIFLFYFLVFKNIQAQPNIIFVTVDGLRWQEVFKGVDSNAIRISPKFKSDSVFIYENFSAKNAIESRKKLMPFFWNVICNQGQIFGNRELQNFVNAKNPYHFSYPGYSEILCGKVDSLVNSNEYKSNPNENIFDMLSKQKAYKNTIVTFGAWRVFDSILHSNKAPYPVYAAFKPFGDKQASEKEKLISKMNNNVMKFFGNDECLDVFTHYAAMEYIKTKKPKVVFIGYGETDEWAHEGRYKYYLNATHQVDKFLQELWNYFQSDLQYKNNTILIFTTDHGRGNNIESKWSDHNYKTKGSDEAWFSFLGKNIPAIGERNNADQYYLEQIVPTILELLKIKNTSLTTPTFRLE